MSGKRMGVEAKAGATQRGLLRILADLFPGRERLAFGGVFLMSAAAAAVETAGVATILPFMALVLDPSAISRYPFIYDLADGIGLTTSRSVLLFVGTLTIFVVALGSLASAWNIVAQQRFIARSTVRLSTTLFRGYMLQPYRFHVQRDAPSLMKVILTDIRVVMTGVVTPFLQAMARGLMVIGVLALLFVQDAALALTLALVVGGAYALIYTFARRRQRQLGLAFNQNNERRHRVAQESLGGVKELAVLGREAFAIAEFRRAEVSAADTEAANNVMAQVPRYALEALAFGGILLLALMLVANDPNGSATIVPTLALYAFAGYRLMPAAQQVFHSAAKIRFSISVLAGVHDDLRQVMLQGRETADRSGDGSPPQPLQRRLSIEQVSFRYDGASRPALVDVTVEIPAGASIGIVGRTGSGKTTLADLILGLYEPEAGTISVDGVTLSPGNVRAWQRQVGYVPQHVFLANASIAANIAFGLPDDEIDRDAVRRAADLAQASDFIQALPQGFETVVGERGVRLSGGQRQRLGIARALYHAPSVLVFDEATSALDGLTEDALMREVSALSGERTVVLIAHRLRTVETCDRILLMEGGRLLAVGSYADLMRDSQSFRELAGAGMRPVSSGAGN